MNTKIVYLDSHVNVSDIVIFTHFDKMYIGRVDEIESNHYSNGNTGYRILTNKNPHLMPTHTNSGDYSDWMYWVPLDDIVSKFCIDEIESFGSFEYFGNLFNPNK